MLRRRNLRVAINVGGFGGPSSNSFSAATLSFEARRVFFYGFLLVLMLSFCVSLVVMLGLGVGCHGVFMSYIHDRRAVFPIVGEFDFSEFGGGYFLA